MIKLKKSILTSDNAKLYTELKNFVFDVKYKITGFSVDVNDRGKLIPMITKGNKVSPEMREVFKNLPVGTPVYFNNIFCRRT